MSLVGCLPARPFRFPDALARVPVLPPESDNKLRLAFDLGCEQLGIRPRSRAEVDEMALLRLRLRDSASVALMPTVVVQDELRTRATHRARCGP